MAMDFNPILKFGWAIAQLIALCIVLLSIAPLYDCVAADNRSVKALLGEARAAAEKVTSEHIRWDLLLEIESIAIVSGDQDLARSNLREMTQDAIKRENHLYLERIALAYVEAGDMSAASEIWASFSQEMADNLLVGTTRTLAENENLDGAFKTAEFVKRGVYKSTALAYVGVGEPQAGNVAEALRIREMIRSISSKEWTSEISILASVALHQAKSDRNKAEETLAAALELAMELPRTTLLDVPRIRALNIVASTWAKIGSEEGTLKTISRIGGDPEAAERATLEAALAAAKAGKTSVSRNLLARIPEEGEEDRYVGFTAQIVSTFVALGDLENAFEAIPRLADDCDILAEAVGEIALAQAASGDYESALATIRTVGTFAEPSIVSIKSRTLAKIIGLMAEAQKFQDALLTVDKIIYVATEKTDANTYECALMRGIVPDDLAKTDWRTGTNHSIAEASKARAYRSIAKSLTAAGRLEEAIGLARDSVKPRVSTSIFIGAAEAVIASTNQ